MAIVLDAKQIIDGGIVENERIEYKEGWNPESILHTVCAFANDIENQSGGYIIIGVRAEHGKPTGVVGVDSGSVDRINADLMNLCHQIVPRYLVESEYMDYDGKGVLVIKVPGGADRPYRCPVSLAERYARWVVPYVPTLQRRRNSSGCPSAYRSTTGQTTGRPYPILVWV